MVFEFANIIFAICKQFIVCIIMSYYFHFSVWNWSNAMNIQSAPRILMAWCWSTRASVATVLSGHLRVSSCSWINQSEFLLPGAGWNISNISNVYMSPYKHFPRYWAFCEGNPFVTDGFSSQKPVTRSLYVFFDLRLNKQLSKRSRNAIVLIMTSLFWVCL